MLIHEHARTLAIVRELAHGKKLSIDGRTIAMGEDMSIGFEITGSDGEIRIGGLSTMDLAQLNNLLNQHNIHFPVLKPTA